MTVPTIPSIGAGNYPADLVTSYNVAWDDIAGKWVPMASASSANSVTSSSLINFSYDAYNKVSESTTVDRFDYYQGGLAGTKVADITITYEDSSKINAISAVRVNV